MTVLSAGAARPEAALASSPLVQVEGLVKYYPLRQAGLRGGREVVRAVDDVSFAIAAGQTLGLVGESGCGKTTLGRLLLRLETPTAGRVRFAGLDMLALPERRLRPLRRQMQIVFQDPYEALNPRWTVGEIVAEPLFVHRIGTAHQRKARVAELLALVGLDPGLAGRYPHECSGGQRQRVAIARALATGPRFLVLDEPVSALDVTNQVRLLALLRELKERLGLTLLLIAHSLNVVRAAADRVAVMYLGKWVEAGPTAVLFERPLHPYTKALLSAMPQLDQAARRERIVLAGEPPSPASPPPGCRFHPRCPYRLEVCTRSEPRLVDVGGGQQVACHLYTGG